MHGQLKELEASASPLNDQTHLLDLPREKREWGK